MRMLDLFCGHGVGAWGYWRSGKFSEIVGMDCEPFGRVYPFDFVRGDAMKLDYDFLMSFDFIHASPPCQGYSKMTPDRTRHLRLIAATHLMLVAAGKPYVIENVEGSSRELKPNLVLNGIDVGVPMMRKRYFHLSWMRSSRKINIDRAFHISSVRDINLNTGANVNDMPVANLVYLHGQYVRKEDAIKAVFAGIDEINTRYLTNVTLDGMEQGIPPAMTKFIADCFVPFPKLLIV